MKLSLLHSFYCFKKEGEYLQSINVIKYKWEHGAYNLEDMIELVKKENITKEDFFTITRYYYDKILEKD